MKFIVRGGMMEAKEPLDLESFTQAHLIAKDTVHPYAKLEGKKIPVTSRTVVMHPSEEGQPKELGYR